MAKKAYVGIDNTARKIKKGYIGIEGVARKIKKAYIGIGGVARPCWPTGQPTYYGPIAELQASAKYLAAAHTTKHALFAGGYNRPSARNQVTSYDGALVCGTAPPLAIARYELSGASVGGYALFAGGRSASSTRYSSVDAYDSALVRVTATALQDQCREAKGLETPRYAFFAGGLINNSGSHRSTVEVFDTDLVKTNAPDLSAYISVISGTYLNGYAIFSWGDTVVYDSDLVSVSGLNLSTNRAATAVSVGEHALFVGGVKGDTYYSTVSVITSELVQGTAFDMNNKKSGQRGLSLGEIAILGGGYEGPGNNTVGPTSSVFYFRPDLTYQYLDDMSTCRTSHAGTSVGDYAIFAGGDWVDEVFSTADAYCIA